MPHAEKIKSFCVMVTRPHPEGEKLCARLRERSMEAIFFPTIEIVPLAHPDFFNNISDFDKIIFISPQSVHAAASFIKNKKFQNVFFIAMGKGTARVLKEYGLPVNAYPEIADSENLLAMSELQDLKNQKIAIVKGENGRELIRQELQKKGADVTVIDAYRRVLPSVSVDNSLDLLRKKTLNVIICTSNEGLKNLKKLLINAWDSLQKTKVLVISQRMQDYSYELGFQNILLAENASDAAIFERLALERKKDE